MPKLSKIIGGFMYSPEGPDERAETICKIIDRAETSDNLEIGPTFVVRFGDGVEMQAHGCDLEPWFPT